MQLKKIHILHTNDIHSHFEQMSLIAGGLEALKDENEQKGEQTLIVDLGDHMDRMSPITEGTLGQANIAVMNATGYEYAGIGNNEGLTFPKDKLESLYEQAKFQLLCCNLLDRKTNDTPSVMKPYVIEDIQSLRVGWISATSPYAVYNQLGWEILDPFEQIQQTVEKIKGETDLIIVLSHLGLKTDKRMAQEIDGIRLIVGAHSHHLLEVGINENNTFIIQAGKFGRYIGHTSIEFNVNTKEILSITGKCYEVNRFKSDHQIDAIIEAKRIEADQALSTLISTIPQPLIVDWQQESPLGNLLAEGLQTWIQGDFSMVNSGQFLFSLPQGDVTQKDLLALCPHSINPCRVKIKGKYIKEILEQALDEENITLAVTGLGFRGKVLGWMCVDGLLIRYDPTRVLGERIIEISVQGSLMDEEQIYVVGTVDMFTYGWIFPLFLQAEEVEYLFPEFIRDVLAKELQREDMFEQINNNRWIPV